MPRIAPDKTFPARVTQALEHGAGAVLDVLDASRLRDLQALPPRTWRRLVACAQQSDDAYAALRIARAVAFIPAAVSDVRTRTFLLSLDDGNVLEGLVFHVGPRSRDQLIRRLVEHHGEYAIHLLGHLLTAGERRRNAARVGVRKPAQARRENGMKAQEAASRTPRSAWPAT